jgi:hypothetical protein
MEEKYFDRLLNDYHKTIGYTEENDLDDETYLKDDSDAFFYNSWDQFYNTYR